MSKLDVEYRVELSALELLQAFAALLTAVGDADNVVRGNIRHGQAAFPCAYVRAHGFLEFGRHTGWYRGSMRLGACSYKADDATGAVAYGILGALRGFAQQTDLPAQLTGTTSAQAAETLLTCEDIECDASTGEDIEREEIYHYLLDVSALVRPSR